MLLRKSGALLDNPQAAYNLGYMHTIGLGVPIDSKESIFWYERAASLGSQDAQINLGFIYILAQGVDKDMKKAASYIKQAKESGNEKAISIWEEFELEKYL